MNISQLKQCLRGLARPEKAEANKRFFKTGPGDYGEGDQFLGVAVPNVRKVAKAHRDLDLSGVEKLLCSPIHEERLLAVILLVEKFPKDSERIYQFYLKHAKRVNNWDLVDVSAHHIVGAFLFGKEKDVLFELAESDNLWERRIAMVSTWYEIRKGVVKTALEIAERLLGDSHDLIHKAVGWMLREVGKKDLPALEAFLQTHIARMPRTTLRYAIERFPEPKRREYLSKPA